MEIIALSLWVSLSATFCAHGLTEPTGGRVLHNGQPLDRAARDRQSMVFQKPVLLWRSVRANVDYVLRGGRQERHLRRAELLAMVGLEGKAGQPARLLSGGEQQRWL